MIIITLFLICICIFLSFSIILILEIYSCQMLHLYVKVDIYFYDIMLVDLWQGLGLLCSIIHVFGMYFGGLLIEFTAWWHCFCFTERKNCCAQRFASKTQFWCRAPFSKRLEGLQTFEVSELKTDTHVFAVYGLNYFFFII